MDFTKPSHSERGSSSGFQQKPFDVARQSADSIRSDEKARREISEIPTNMGDNQGSRRPSYEIKKPLQDQNGTPLTDDELITIGKRYKRKELREHLRTVSRSIDENIPLMQRSLTGAKCNELMDHYTESRNNAYSRVNNRWYVSLERHLLMSENNYNKAKGEAQRFIGALQELSDYLSDLSTHVPGPEGSGDGPSRKDKGKEKEKAADSSTLKSDPMVESSSGEQRLYKGLEKLMEGSNENEKLGKTLKWAIDHLIDKVCIPFLKEYDEKTKRILGELTNIEQTIDRGSTKDILQEQHKELEEYESKRIKLISLKSEIEGRYKEDYLTFYNQLPVSNDTTRRFLLDQAAAKYDKTEPASNVVSPSILSRSENLVERVNRLETVLDEKIAEMQKQQKSAVESPSLGPEVPGSSLQPPAARQIEGREGELQLHVAKQIEEREGELQPHVAIPSERSFATVDPAVRDSDQEEKHDGLKRQEGKGKDKQVPSVGSDVSISQTASKTNLPSEMQSSARLTKKIADLGIASGNASQYKKPEGELKSGVAEQIKELEKPLISDAAKLPEELEEELKSDVAEPSESSFAKVDPTVGEQKAGKGKGKQVESETSIFQTVSEPESSLISDATKPPEELEEELKSDVAEQIKKLEKALEKMFADKLKRMIPDGHKVKDLWRLCIDEKYQHEGATSSRNDGKLT